MSKNHKKLDDRQYDLFEKIQGKSAVEEPKQGSLNISLPFRQILKKCLSNSKWKPEVVAGRMMLFLNNNGDGPLISHHMLYTYEAPSKTDSNRLPAEFLPAYCYAVESFEPIKFLAEQTNLFLMRDDEALKAEIKEIDEKIQEYAEMKKERELYLKIKNKK